MPQLVVARKSAPPPLPEQDHDPPDLPISPLLPDDWDDLEFSLLDDEPSMLQETSEQPEDVDMEAGPSGVLADVPMDVDGGEGGSQRPGLGQTGLLGQQANAALGQIQASGPGQSGEPPQQPQTTGALVAEPTATQDSNHNNPGQPNREVVDPLDPNLIPDGKNHIVRRQKKKKEVPPKPQKRPLSPCSDSCRLKCPDKIPESRREEICTTYNNLPSNQNYPWLKGHMKRAVHEGRKQIRPAKTDRKQSGRIEYSLPLNDTESVVVCQHFFMSTLGKKKHSNGPLVRMMNNCKNGVVPEKMRGKYERTHDIQVTKMIVSHVLSFHPQVSHYGRENSPLCRYLNSDITLKFLHNDYMEKFGANYKACYAKYHRVCRKEMKISFSDQGNETHCSDCIIDNLHQKETWCQKDPECEKCKDQNQHLAEAKLARDMYKKDKERKDEHSYTFDLQKVQLCPRVEGVKEILFLSRICLYNEV